MLRLLDRNHVPQIPKSYAFNGGPSIPWDSRRKTFTEFVQAVQDYAQANGKLIPPVDQIEDQICQRLPRGWCTNQTRFDRPQSTVTVSPARRGGCKSCGRRR